MMRPPDQIPNLKQPEYRRGDLVYVWTGLAYSKKEVVTPHSFQSALTIQDGNGPMIVGPKDVISSDAYEEERREEARDKYRHIIGLWERGVRKSKLMAEELEENPRAIGQMIAAAKRWKLIG